MEFTVKLNGTDTNPYEMYGLKQNPFPQIGDHNRQHAERCLRSLGGVPLKSAEDIRARMKTSGMADWFIDGLVERFKPGFMVEIHCIGPE